MAIFAIAVAVRVAFELLLPIVPYVLAVLVLCIFVRLARWHRGRW